jgi:cytidine deaminase
MIDEVTEDILLKAAHEARMRASVPYSRFLVGAALLLPDGSIVPGCNVENASYGLTVCAERTAIFTAVARGETRPVAIAVVGDTVGPITPCGACRQVLFEFAPDMPVIMANLRGDRQRSTVRELLPGGFGPSDLSGNQADGTPGQSKGSL